MLDADLMSSLLAFRRAREWEQFHTPLNLATALAVEAAEVLEHFQWRLPAESAAPPRDIRALSLELADVAILLSYLANDLGIDLDQAVREKLLLNEQRYPLEKARGRADKHDVL